MRFLVSAVFGAVLASGTCSGAKKDDASSSSSVKVTSKDYCPTGDVAALAEEASQPEVMGIDGGVEKVSAVRPPTPKFSGELMVPPREAGKSLFDVSGCLALDDANEEAGARFPAAAADDAAPKGDHWRVNTVGKGIVVSHDLTHACCLEGAATAEVSEGKVVIVEKLTGQACRCRCSSTVRTAVGLQPGEYSVSVRTEEAGQTRETEPEKVTIAR